MGYEVPDASRQSCATRNVGLLLFFCLLGQSTTSAQENFRKASNGVTVLCTDAAEGETGEIDGVTYTKRQFFEINDDNAETTCTVALPTSNTCLQVLSTGTSAHGTLRVPQP